MGSVGQMTSFDPLVFHFNPLTPQEPTASREKWRPSLKAWRRMKAAAVVSLVTCLTFCPSMPLLDSAGWPGRWWSQSTSWRVTASQITVLPPCCKCLNCAASWPLTMSRLVRWTNFGIHGRTMSFFKKKMSPFHHIILGNYLLCDCITQTGGVAGKWHHERGSSGMQWKKLRGPRRHV